MRGIDCHRRAQALLEEALLGLVAQGLGEGVPGDEMLTWLEPRAPGTGERVAQRLAEELIATAPATHEDEREIRAQYAEYMAFCWGSALDLYWLVVAQCSDIGERLESGSDSTAETGAAAQVQKALFAIAIRSATEIQVLLSAGLGDGAGARARTLYETAVVSSVIAGSPDPDLTAARFRDHQEWEALRDWEAWAAVGKPSPEEASAGHELRVNVDQHIKTHGDSWRQHYGWAAHLVKGRPTFKALEGLTRFLGAHALYQQACYSVHAGPSAVRDVIHMAPEGCYLSSGYADAVPVGSVVLSLLSLDEVMGQYLDSAAASQENGLDLWARAIGHLVEAAADEFIRLGEERHNAISARWDT